MALNQNHTFEDIDEIKCAIAEKNCTKERSEFLKTILEFNNYKVIVKNTTPQPASDLQTEPVSETFTVGVTDVTFNPVKAIFNRELKAPNGKTVTPSYWKQEQNESEDGNWYWK